MTVCSNTLEWKDPQIADVLWQLKAMYSNPTSDACISHGNWAGSLISCSAKHPKAFRERPCLIFTVMLWSQEIIVTVQWGDGEL